MLIAGVKHVRSHIPYFAYTYLFIHVYIFIRIVHQLNRASFEGKILKGLKYVVHERVGISKKFAANIYYRTDDGNSIRIRVQKIVLNRLLKNAISCERKMCNNTQLLISIGVNSYF